MFLIPVLQQSDSIINIYNAVSSCFIASWFQLSVDSF